MAENFKCSGDCIKCSVVQRQYCASQNTYNTMKMLEDLRTLLESMMKRSEEESQMVFSTIEKEEAQKGSGAERIDSLNKLKD